MVGIADGHIEQGTYLQSRKDELGALVNSVGKDLQCFGRSDP